MKRSVLMNSAKPLVLMLALALLVGCAAGNVKSSASVDDRVNAYWAEVLEGDYMSSYQYLSPGYRSSVDANRYQRSMLLKKVKWEEANIIESDCVDISCKVTISLKYTVFGAVPGVNSFTSTQKVIESWVLADGIWYLVPER